mgnify:CR=1 FL=1
MALILQISTNLRTTSAYVKTLISVFLKRSFWSSKTGSRKRLLQKANPSFPPLFSKTEISTLSFTTATKPCQHLHFPPLKSNYFPYNGRTNEQSDLKQPAEGIGASRNKSLGVTTWGCGSHIVGKAQLKEPGRSCDVPFPGQCSLLIGFSSLIRSENNDKVYMN